MAPESVGEIVAKNIEEGPAELDNNSAPLRDDKGLLLPGTPSLNPTGRPKGSYSIMTIIKKKMEEIPIGQVKEWKEQIADIILEKAVVGKDMKALEMIVEYMDGKPKQSVDLDVNKEGVESLTNLLREISKQKDGSGPTTTTTSADEGGSAS